MQSQGLFSIGGIASGLDTNDIVEQLLQLERQPVKRLEQRKDELAGTKDAWSTVSSKLSTLRGAVDRLNRVDRFDDLRSVTSSNEDAVSISANGRVAEGSLSFTVENLATSMQRASADSFTSPDDLLDGRTLELTIDGETLDLTAELGGDATLQDLVDAVNDAGTGVRATALQVEPGRFQLVLDAEGTGTAGAFDVTSTGWNNGFAVTQDAEDARLTVGGVSVTRSSNTIDDLIDGATIDLRRATNDPVTITSARDVDGAVEAVREVVDAVNSAIATIGELTAFDPETREAAPLQGEMAARRIADELRYAVSRPLAGMTGSDALASSLGITSTRDGRLELDEDTLRTAFADDFAGTAAKLARSGAATDDAALFLSATRASQPGTYEVEVTQAAEQARATGAYTPPGAGEEHTFRVSGPGTRTADVTLTESHASLADAVTAINQQLDDAGHTAVRAIVDGGQLVLHSTAYGSSTSFRVDALDAAGQVDGAGTVYGLEGEHAGVDVAGTIGGEAATGRGRTLTSAAGSAEGTSVRIDGQPAPFELTWTRGVIGEVGSTLSRFEGRSGAVSRATAAIDREVALYEDRIEAFLDRIESREITLRRQYTQLEVAMGRLNEQGQWLGQQLAGLAGQQG